MRASSKFPARVAAPVGIPRPATSMPFVFPARRNGHAMTEIMRPASPIWISHNPGGGPVLEAYRFRRQLYYATCAILVSIPSSYSEGVRYPSPF